MLVSKHVFGSRSSEATATEGPWPHLCSLGWRTPFELIPSPPAPHSPVLQSTSSIEQLLGMYNGNCLLQAAQCVSAAFMPQTAPVLRTHVTIILPLLAFNRGWAAGGTASTSGKFLKAPWFSEVRWGWCVRVCGGGGVYYYFCNTSNSLLSGSSAEKGFHKDRKTCWRGTLFQRNVLCWQIYRENCQHSTKERARER